MLDLFLPIHDMLSELMGSKLCCWPGVFGFCPEFWLGFILSWWLVKAEPATKLADVFDKFINKEKEEK